MALRAIQRVSTLARSFARSLALLSRYTTNSMKHSVTHGEQFTDIMDGFVSRSRVSVGGQQQRRDSLVPSHRKKWQSCRFAFQFLTCCISLVGFVGILTSMSSSTGSSRVSLACRNRARSTCLRWARRARVSSRPQFCNGSVIEFTEPSQYCNYCAIAVL